MALIWSLSQKDVEAFETGFNCEFTFLILKRNRRKICNFVFDTNHSFKWHLRNILFTEKNGIIEKFKVIVIYPIKIKINEYM